ncbi:MAG: DNA alkylation repair protein [Thermoplasmata archaeon]
MNRTTPPRAAASPGSVPFRWREYRRLLRARLERAARPTDFDLRAYLGSPLPVLGVAAADLRAIARQLKSEHPHLAPAVLRSLAAGLWRGPSFEERSLALLIVADQLPKLGAAAWTLTDRWVDDATGWGLCDSLAGGPVAEMVAASPARLRSLLGWTRSTNLWRRRAALYALNRLVRAGRLTESLRVIDRLLEDREFWVQRAVGTWLRECGKKDERRIRRYLLQNASRLYPVAITVATERATPAFRAELRSRAARAGRRRNSRSPPVSADRARPVRS